jgi:hypothetical protein
MREGPFSDDVVRHMVMTAQTHEAIREHGEAMAEFLAEASVASEKARGDNAIYALRQWLNVIEERAKALIGEKRRQADAKKISAPDVVEHKP